MLSLKFPLPKRFEKIIPIAKSKINIPMSKMKNVINNNIGKKIIFAYRKNIQKKTSL